MLPYLQVVTQPTMAFKKAAAASIPTNNIMHRAGQSRMMFHKVSCTFRNANCQLEIKKLLASQNMASVTTATTQTGFCIFVAATLTFILWATLH